MKLYDSNVKFCHCNVKSLLSNDMTIAFCIKFNNCLKSDYILLEKEGEFSVKLNKKKQNMFLCL